MAVQSAYTDEQREALTAAYDMPGVSAQTAADMARRGELAYRGETLRPFTVSAGTVRGIAHRVRARRSPVELAEANRRYGEMVMKTAVEELTVERRKPKGERDLRKVLQAAGIHERMYGAIRAAGPARSAPAPVSAAGSGPSVGGALLQAHRAVPPRLVSDAEHDRGEVA